MSTFFKAICLVILAVILGLTISKQWKEASLLLILLACCMVLTIALEFLQPVLDLIDELQNEANLDPVMLQVLLKVTGIGLISQIAIMICNDAGNSSLGKTVQILASAVILWLAVPLFNELLKLLRDILGGI